MPADWGFNMPINRAFNRGQVVELGRTFMVEFTQEPSLDAFCHEVETTGGMVHEISDHTTEAVDNSGRLRRMRRYSVVFTLPE